MDIMRSHSGNSQAHHHGLSTSARKWPVAVVLLVAVALALAVPLAGRAFGMDKTDFPGCAIAPWTGTCTCMLNQNGAAIAYEEFVTIIRQPGIAPRGADADAILAGARKNCRMDRPFTRSAAQ